MWIHTLWWALVLPFSCLFSFCRLKLKTMRFNHLILLLQTIRLRLCFLSIWWGNLTLFFPTICSHALWRWRSVLLLIGIDRNSCRNNRGRLLQRFGPHPRTLRFNIWTCMTAHAPKSACNSGWASMRHPHQLWTSSENHPLHPISWRNHCFTTISIFLFIRKPLARPHTRPQTMHPISQHEYWGTKQSPECKETSCSP